MPPSHAQAWAMHQTIVRYLGGPQHRDQARRLWDAWAEEEGYSDSLLTAFLEGCP